MLCLGLVVLLFDCDTLFRLVVFGVWLDYLW